jgi:hypothetical protein
MSKQILRDRLVVQIYINVETGNVGFCFDAPQDGESFIVVDGVIRHHIGQLILIPKGLSDKIQFTRESVKAVRSRKKLSAFADEIGAKFDEICSGNSIPFEVSTRADIVYDTDKLVRS